MTPMLLADSPIHLAPLDIVVVSGPLAVLMIVLELASYWRYGRAPATSRNRLTAALALAGVLVPAAIVAMVHWHASALLIIGAVLFVWVVHSYRRTTSPISRGTRLLCVGIRMLVILLVLTLLLRPTFRQVKVIYENAALFILYDTSKSMTIEDAGSGGARVARIDAVRRAVKANADRMARLATLFDVKQYGFDEGLGRALKDPSDDLAAVPDGESTAIGRAVQQAYQSLPGKKVAGVILLTDGSNNLSGPGTDPLQVAASLSREGSGVAFWPVGVGQETLGTGRPVVIAKSISLSERRVPAFNVLPVHAVFEFVNLPEHPVTIELVFGQGTQAKVADSEVVTASAGKDRDTISVDLEVTPTTTGFHAVTVKVADGETFSGQSLAGEHSRITDYVQVVDDLIQVLYVEGKFRLEARYLIDALAGSNLMRLDRQFVLTSAALDAGRSGQLPGTEAEWKKYHVVVLGDVKADAFTAEQLRTVRDMVRDMGKGLLMLGGRDSFGRGGWPGSPVAEVMPFDLGESAGQITQPFKLTATRQGLTHQLMRLDESPAKNAQLWGKLPTIQGANRFPDARRIVARRPGAVILATTPASHPVMVAQQAGKGRVLAMAIDTTWRWRLHLEEGAVLHNRFWRQVILWLSNRQGNVWVTTDQPRYRLSQVRRSGSALGDRQKIIVKAGLENQVGKPVVDAEATLTEVLPADASGREEQISIPLGPQTYKQDHYELELPAPARDGSYRLVFGATLEGKPVKAETSFLVESSDVELSRPLANFDLLRQIATAGETAGGKFYTLDQFDELLDRFKSSDYLVKREEMQTTELGDRFRWPILVLILLGLMAEWVIRKRKSLV